MYTARTPPRKSAREHKPTVKILYANLSKAEGDVSKCLSVSIAAGDSDAIHSQTANVCLQFNEYQKASRRLESQLTGEERHEVRQGRADCRDRVHEFIDRCKDELRNMGEDGGDVHAPSIGESLASCYDNDEDEYDDAPRDDNEGPLAGQSTPVRSGVPNAGDDDPRGPNHDASIISVFRSLTPLGHPPNPAHTGTAVDPPVDPGVRRGRDPHPHPADYGPDDRRGRPPALGRRASPSRAPHTLAARAVDTPRPPGYLERGRGEVATPISHPTYYDTHTRMPELQLSRRGPEPLPVGHRDARGRVFNPPASERLRLQRLAPPEPSGHQATGAAADVAYALGRLELLREPRHGEKYGGKIGEFNYWAEGLLARIEMVPGLSGMAKLRVLQAHTKDEAKELVDTYAEYARADRAEQKYILAWQALRERFGLEDYAAQRMDLQITNMKQITSERDLKSLGHLRDMCVNVRDLIEDAEGRDRGLLKYNESDGICILAGKLPVNLQKDWEEYCLDWMDAYPRFDPDLSVFIDYLAYTYKRKSNPFFRRVTDFSPREEAKGENPGKSRPKKALRTGAPPVEPPTEVNAATPGSADKKGKPPHPKGGKGGYCSYHKQTGHRTAVCNEFRALAQKDKQEFLNKNSLCLKCSYNHKTEECTLPDRIRCSVCNGNHVTILHGLTATTGGGPGGATGATPAAAGATPPTIVSRRTTRGDSSDGECVGVPFSKTLLVSLRHKDNPGKIIKCCVMLDDQSHHTFTDEYVVKSLGLQPPRCEYNLETLAGLTYRVQGFAVSDLQIKGIRGEEWYDLPVSYTGGHIPDSRAERATRTIVEGIPSLAHLAHLFEEENPVPQTLLLVGLDMAWSSKTHCEGKYPPFAHKTILGWSIVNTLPREELPRDSLAFQMAGTSHAEKAFRGSIVRDVMFQATPRFLERHECLSNMSDVFQTREDDEELAWSRDDDTFIGLLKEGTTVGEDGTLQIPLPIKPLPLDCPLSRNEPPMFHRNKATLVRAARDETMLNRTTAAMKRHLELGHVEKVPQEDLLSSRSKCTLPTVLVVQEKKDSVRITLDGGASYKGMSLNDMLYSGPDLNNSLRGVLHRFRTLTVAFSLDIKHMYNCFLVPPEQRDMLRFHWWDDNDPSKGIALYRSRVHPFGLRSSGGVAMFALKFLAALARETGALGERECRFLEEAFYMDDGMDSLASVKEVVTLIRAVATFLKAHGLYVHKVNSNSREVREAFVAESSECSLIGIDPNTVPRALGVTWDTEKDSLSTVLQLPDRPFTRRGILATVNTVFDPIGLASPVVLGGRLLQRKILTQYPVEQKTDWDAELPESFAIQWQEWKEGVESEQMLEIPRCLIPSSAAGARCELHVFSDASEHAIGVVAYLRLTTTNGEIHVTFIGACSRLAPRTATSIPRLELSAALLAAEYLFALMRDLRIEFACVKMYTDSMIVLGYLRNTSKCFTKYVTRRVEGILRICSVDQWNYVPTTSNPADLATRPITASALKESDWFCGPEFLRTNKPVLDSQSHSTLLQTLPETVPNVRVSKTTCPSTNAIWPECAVRISSWSRLLKTVVAVFDAARVWESKVRPSTNLGEVTILEARATLWKASQTESFPEVFRAGEIDPRLLQNLPEGHPLSGLVPVLSGGLIRVGGRLRHAATPFEEKHPILLSSRSIIAQRFVEYCHITSPHQGKGLTMNKVRSQGVYVLGLRRLVDSLIKSCVMCKRLRGTQASQLMGELPAERVTESCAFDHCGIDVFGPFYISEGQTTRRRSSQVKVFVLLVNCLASRAVHLEPLAGMDTTSVINALRRFMAIRGDCRSLVSDHGSNFIGALGESEQFYIKKEVESRGIKWTLNPVGASHYGGAFERKIGSVRRVLEAFLQPHPHPLNRDEFYTMLQEAAAVVNSTPLYPAPEGVNEPLALSPSNLLTLKTRQSSLPPEQLSEKDVHAYGKRRWRRIQLLADAFWTKWRENYLQTLTRRAKWCKDRPNLKDGDVVLLREKGAPRCDWRLAVVRRVVPGADARVRRAVVAISGSEGRLRETERAITDFVLLFSP